MRRNWIDRRRRNPSLPPRKAAAVLADSRRTKPRPLARALARAVGMAAAALPKAAAAAAVAEAEADSTSLVSPCKLRRLMWTQMIFLASILCA